MNKIKAIIELIRIKHWIKNLLVFVPMVCARKFDLSIVATVGIGFLSFSFLTSFVYIINDIRDIKKDRIHPRKKKRPLPSGRIGKNEAIMIAIVMLIVSIVFNYLAKLSFVNISWIFLALYLVVNLGYSFGLKNIAVIDIVLLSIGFIIRVYYGGALADVAVSNWLFLTILSASMFLALGKRKKEFVSGASVRSVLAQYKEEYVDKFVYVFLALMLVFYSLWAMEQESGYFIFTVPVVMLIFMKYCLIMEKSDEGDPTTIVYQSKGLMSLCAVYGIIMIILFCI